MRVNWHSDIFFFFCSTFILFIVERKNNIGIYVMASIFTHECCKQSTKMGSESSRKKELNKITLHLPFAELLNDGCFNLNSLLELS